MSVRSDSIKTLLLIAVVGLDCRQIQDNLTSIPIEVQTPKAPVLFSPPNGRGIGVPSILTLRWKQVLGANSYSVELASDSLFRQMAFSAYVETLSVNTTPLDPNRYYWHVKASLSNSRETPWSETWWFLRGSIIIPID